MFKDKVKELVNTEKICGVHLRMGFWRLVKNFMERENEGGSKEAHGGKMRKCKKQKRKKNAFREMCKIQSEENKDNYQRDRNQIRKVVSREMRREAEQEINDSCDKPNNVFKLVKFLKKEGQDVNSG